MLKKKDKINTRGAANTGDKPTVVVAIEQNFPKEERIIQDAIAPQIISGSGRFWVYLTKINAIRNWMVNASEKSIQGIWSCFLVRKRYIDERLVQEVDQNGINAIVNLGAGFDTRLYRLPEVQHIPSWEVDQAVNINTKRERLQKVFKEVPNHVKLVPINFLEQEIGDALEEQGYLGEAKTFFIWEAVSQYLDETAVNKTFDFFAKAPTGSKLAFTYVPKDFITGENLYGAEKFYKQAVKRKLWHFGFNPNELAAYLKIYGWQLIEDLSYAELNNRYVKPTGRKLGVMEIERMVYAEKL